MSKHEKLDKMLENYLKNARTIDWKKVQPWLDAMDINCISLFCDWYGMWWWKYLQWWYRKNDKYWDLNTCELYYFLKKLDMLYIYDILDAFTIYDCKKSKDTKENNLKKLYNIKQLLRKNYEYWKKWIDTSLLYNDINYCINCDYFINDYHTIDKWVRLLDYTC